MGRLKEMIKDKGENIKTFIKKYPITIVLILITTALCMFMIEDWDSKIAENAIIFVIAGFGTFFIESTFEKKRYKIPGMLISGIIAVIIKNILVKMGELSYAEENIQQIIFRILPAYLGILFLSSIYMIHKKSKLKIEKYILEITKNIFANGIIYIILNIGISIILGIIIQLFLNDTAGEIFSYFQIFLFGVYFVPSMLQAIVSVKDKETNKFVKSVIIYVLLPLIMVTMVIIYVYIAKIFIFNEIPSNTIYRIIATLFIFAFPIWILASNFETENKIIGKVTKIMPIAFIPFILLEIYSIGTRIGEFGITPVRYFGIVYIIIQVIVLILNIYKNKEKLQYALIVTGVILIFTNVLPFTNYANVSKTNQSNILKKGFPEDKLFEELSEEEKDKIKGAYRYLRNQYDKEKYIPKYILEQEENIFRNNQSDIYTRSYRKGLYKLLS